MFLLPLLFALAQNPPWAPPGMQCEQRTLVNLAYGENAPKIREHMKDHMAFNVKVMKAGDLVLAGPATNGDGAVAVYRSNKWEEVEPLAKADPLVVAGVLTIQGHKAFWACSAAPEQ